jgi:glycosyltransferase involved in cell wall biosynthesis
VPPLLREARHVLTNSQFTAAEIQRCTGLPAQRITVIPLGYDADHFTPGDPQGPSPQQPYLLHVGQAYPHKNLRRLLQAFAQVSPTNPELRLVLAGKPHPTETPQLKALAAELGLQQRVEFRAYVLYAELPDLYRGALAFVFPSLWEGFGLPVLEAMACGTPVITSAGSGTEEVAGDAALLVDPADTDELSQALGCLIEQPKLREQCRKQGLERAKRFSWAATAVATRALLETF